ncbi:MAG: HPr family phosphocarrier protein [Pyrinomonadaceae bacterium]
MLEGNVRVINPLGLHARAAAQLVKLANRFSSKIIVKRLDNQTNAYANSILGLLALAASTGTTLHLRVEGQDEQLAFEAVEDIFSKGFGEI